MDNPVAIFVGENGTGKSTPPEAAAVAYGLNTEGGAKRFIFSANATQGLFCKGGIYPYKINPDCGSFVAK